MTEWGAYDVTPPRSKELADGHSITVRKPMYQIYQSLVVTASG